MQQRVHAAKVSEVSEIAGQGEERCDGEDGGERYRGEVKRTWISFATGDPSEGCRYEQRGESVELKRLQEVSAQKSGECACGSAARAEDAEVEVNGTLRIEAVLRGREAEEDCAYGENGEDESRGCSPLRQSDGGAARLGRDEAAPKMGHPAR